MRGKYLLAGLIIGLLLISVGAATVKASNTNFSPKEVWTYHANIDTTYDFTIDSPRNVMKTSIEYDVNGDGINDVLVEIHNYTAMSYTIILLSGADGSVLYKNKFVDVASTHNNDQISIEASVYSSTYLDNNGNLVARYQFVIFQNHSDTHRISIYKLGSDLSNESYGYIEMPDAIHTPYGDVSINYYAANIYIQNYNYSSKLGIFFIGYYSGSYYTYNLAELQGIMLDYDLNQIWNKTYKTMTTPGFTYMAMGITQLNGWGFNQENTEYQGADIIMINESSGNLELEAIEASNGNMLWNVTIPGITLMTSPFILPMSYINFIDYNNDNDVDIEIMVISNNHTYLYFIDSGGHVLARYDAGVQTHITNPLPTYKFDPSKLRSTEITAMDLNGDGYRDAVFTANLTKLVAFDIKNNATIYTKNLFSQYQYSVLLSIQDINNDGINDLFLYGTNDSASLKYTYRYNIEALSGSNGNSLWNITYNNGITPCLGPMYPTYFSDLNGDGFGEDLIIHDYVFSSSGVYVNVTVISLKDGNAILNFTVESSVSDSSFANWTVLGAMIGDVNGDGTNDIEIMMYHSTTINSGEPSDDTFIRFYDGTSGTLLWKGDVIGEHTTTDVERMSWSSSESKTVKPENNNILITTEDSVSDYQVESAVPEFGNFYIPIILVTAAVIFYIRRK